MFITIHICAWKKDNTSTNSEGVSSGNLNAGLLLTLGTGGHLWSWH